MSRHSSVEVFDLSGRRVANVRQGRLAAGRISLDWNARADDGQPVAPGVYRARVQVGGASAAARIVRVD